ncbi:MAG: DUF5522 domain-containing protein [Chryseolinea sp.]
MDDNKEQEPPMYYMENGFMVFTAAYLLKRGSCCQNGCRHCPYGFKKSINSDSSNSKNKPE